MSSKMSFDARGKKSPSTSPASRAEVNLRIYRDSIISCFDVETFDMEGSSDFPATVLKSEAEFAQHVYDEYVFPILKDKVRCTESFQDSV